MFFDAAEEIPKLAARVGCAVIVVPEATEIRIKNALILAPEEKSVITIEQVREVTGRLATKQTDDRYVIVRPADKLSPDAANAFLKNLEEPGEKIHYLLVTEEPAALLPTIRSRAALFVMRTAWSERSGVVADEKVKILAKRLMAARPAELPELAEEIAKKKDGVRAYALSVLGAAIEMLYKSYFITGKEVFVRKLPNFLEAYENIAKNGHVKLHLVADLV